METPEADELVLQNWRSQGTARGMSVLDSHEVLFPMVEIGTHHPKWISVKNPSHQPVVMQLILNSGEIVDECRDPNELLQPSSSSSLVHNKGITPTRYGFSIADNAVTEAYVHPYGIATFGPIFFHPSSRCWWKSSALIRNNLSGVEWLPLRGFGGSLSLVLFEGSDPVQTIEFKFNLPRSLNFSPPDISQSTDSNRNACSQPHLKELYAKNTGDLPVEVSRIEISGKECGLDGFLVHTCKGFALEPGESTKLIISHQTDFSAAMLQRDLQLALASGILVIPMKVSLPMSTLNFCKRSVLWMRVKKSWVPITLVTSVMFLLFCRILPQVISFRSQDFLFRSGKCSIAAISHQGKSSRMHRNQKDGGKFAMSAKINGFSRSINDNQTLMSESGGRSSDCQCVASEQGTTAEPVNLTMGYRSQNKCFLDTQTEMTLPPSLLSKSVAVETSVLQEAALPGKLTVKVGKEKGKRRRKKKGSGAGLAAQFEVSSSQSGNSTPSSPLSPVTSITPKRLWPLSLDSDQRPEARNPFAHIADRRREKFSGTEIGSTTNMLEPISSVKFDSSSMSCPTQEKPPTPRQKATPVLLSSATFPSTGKSAPNSISASPLLASTSPIAPHARAPGSKLGDPTTVETLDKKGNEDDFKYDIWGDHLFGQHLTGRSGEVYAKSRFATKYDSDSFFLRGPQIPFVGSHQEG